MKLINEFLKDNSTMVQQNSLNSLFQASFDYKEYTQEVFPYLKRYLDTEYIWLKVIIIRNLPRILSKTDSFNYEFIMNAIPLFIVDDELVSLTVLKIIP